jgi:hypothetical protein
VAPRVDVVGLGEHLPGFDRVTGLLVVEVEPGLRRRFQEFVGDGSNAFGLKNDIDVLGQARLAVRDRRDAPGRDELQQCRPEALSGEHGRCAGAVDSDRYRFV